jgi:hypothetical protein
VLAGFQQLPQFGFNGHVTFHGKAGNVTSCGTAHLTEKMCVVFLHHRSRNAMTVRSVKLF